MMNLIYLFSTIYGLLLRVEYTKELTKQSKTFKIDSLVGLGDEKMKELINFVTKEKKTKSFETNLHFLNTDTIFNFKSFLYNADEVKKVKIFATIDNKVVKDKYFPMLKMLLRINLIVNKDWKVFDQLDQKIEKFKNLENCKYYCSCKFPTKDLENCVDFRIILKFLEQSTNKSLFYLTKQFIIFYGEEYDLAFNKELEEFIELEEEKIFECHDNIILLLENIDFNNYDKLIFTKEEIKFLELIN